MSADTQTAMGVVTLVLALGAAWLLVGAGIAKVREPGPTLSAVRSLVPVAPSWAVPMIGVGEVAVGVGFVVAPGVATALVLSAWYALLGVAALALRRSHRSCGCFGASSGPVTVGHVVVCAAAALAAAVLAAAGLPSGVPVSLLVVVHLTSVGAAVGAYGALGPLPILREKLRELRL